MSAEEKLIQDIRDWFIVRDGEKFLKLSENDQNNLILAVIQGYIEKEKNK